MRVHYRHISPQQVFYARGNGPYEPAARDAWRRVNLWLEQHGGRAQVRQAFGFFRDNPRSTEPELLRYDACVPVSFGLEADPKAGIGRQMLPGGAYAVHAHVGSYADAGELLSRLHREIVPTRGLAVDYDRAFLAIYCNDPAITREPHRRTELCVPVLPMRMSLAVNDDGEKESAVPAQQGIGW